MTGKHTSRRRPWHRAVIALIAVTLLISIPWAWDSIQKANWDAHSGPQEVEISGAVRGDDFEVSSSGSVETWAEYEEPAVNLYVARVSDDSRQTAVLSLVFDHAGTPVRCESARVHLVDVGRFRSHHRV